MTEEILLYLPRERIPPIPVKYTVKGNCWICTSHKEYNHNGIVTCIGRDAKGVRRFCSLPRYVYSRLVGQVTSKMVIRHTCDNPSCINPSHLLIGTQADNVRDMWERNRNAKVNGGNGPNPAGVYPKQLEPWRFCPGIDRGFRGEKHGQSRLTEKQVKEIFLSKESTSKIATRFVVGRSTIWNIKSGVTWKYLNLSK
jgi:hypothetical protein